MKTFHCDHCRFLAFFENVRCGRCGHTLAFLPDAGVVASLDPVGDIWTSPLPRIAGWTYRLCANSAEGVCNWAVPSNDPEARCRSCRLTRAVPDPSRPLDRAGWARLEAAKRRLVYTLEALRLPLDGLVFDFPGDPAALTGHANGVITVNVAEADDAERERRRVGLGEPYRTLVGHMRHESGHFYFDRLIAPTARIEAFRALFGDDRQDYAEALKRHYAGGPPGDWPMRCVTAYAAAHPWEDWAETWAHYLHMADALETASSAGLSLAPPRADEPAVEALPDPVGGDAAFDEMLAGWYPLTYLLNNLNRGLGLLDPYPFILSPAAVAKLRFVHDTITARATR